MFMRCSIQPVFLVLLLLVAARVPASGQSPTDEARIRRLATQFETAWNTHDMNLLGDIVTADVDFVNVAGLHWKGRDEVVREHAARHKIRFKDSVWTTDRVTVQFLRPDVALVHLEWRTRGDLDFDLKPWPPRSGLFLWVVVRDNGVWRVRAVQNTDKS
jgi:uncharacterized protein (TIGR02246 family)